MWALLWLFHALPSQPHCFTVDQVDGGFAMVRFDDGRIDVLRLDARDGDRFCAGLPVGRAPKRRSLPHRPLHEGEWTLDALGELR